MKTFDSVEAWKTEAVRLFGLDSKNWKFICPMCKSVQSFTDFEKCGMTKEEIQKVLGFSCVGRFNNKTKGCDWTLGGLLLIHEVEVMDNEGKLHPIFEFYNKTDLVAA